MIPKRYWNDLRRGSQGCISSKGEVCVCTWVDCQQVMRWRQDHLSFSFFFYVALWLDNHRYFFLLLLPYNNEFWVPLTFGRRYIERESAHFFSSSSSSFDDAFLSKKAESGGLRVGINYSSGGEIHLSRGWRSYAILFKYSVVETRVLIV